MKAIAIKVYLEGQDCWLLTEPEKNAITDYGELIGVDFKHSWENRSYEQLNLYWACCGLVGDNTGRTKKQVDKQCKIDCKFYKDDFYVKNDGEKSTVYLELDSISFSKAGRDKANEYFNAAFPQLASYIGVTEEELIREAQSKMQEGKICKLCGKRATDKHHLFSNTKQNRAKYGKLIDDVRNIVWLCNGCHLIKPIPKYSERQFRKALGIEEES